MAASKYLRTALRRMARMVTEDSEVRAARTSVEDLTVLRAQRSAIELVAAACERFSERPCLATRRDAADAVFEPITFGALWRRAIAFATGLHHLELVRAGDLVGICGAGSVEWIVADLACLYLGAVSVPLQPSLAAADLAHVLDEARPVCIVSSREHAALIRGALRHPVRAVIVPEPHGGELAMAAVEARGSEGPPISFARPAEGALFSIVYTSGSSGRPKGVMIPEARWQRTLREPLATTPMPTITVAYLPLAHMAGRISLYTTLMAGGSTSFVTRPDMSTLFDDVRLVRPTSLTLVPRIAGMIHQHFQTELVRRGGRVVAGAALEADPLAAEVIGEMRDQFLGDRLCFLTTGAAPTPLEILVFLERTFEVHVVDTYGSTELGRVAVNGQIQPGVDYKLVDVPELGYTSSDRPYPRGELAVRSAQGTPGYFDRGASASLRDADGYILSGDIVEEHAPGQIVWIDRRQGVLRLAHGEFVNVSRLEGVFTCESPFIEQIFVHGDPLHTYLLAVIVPNLPAVSVELVRRGDIDGRPSIEPHSHSGVLPGGGKPRPSIEPHSHSGVLPGGGKPRPSIEPHSHSGVLPGGGKPRPSIEPHSHSGVLPGGGKPRPSIEPHSHSGVLPGGGKPRPSIEPDVALRELLRGELDRVAKSSELCSHEVPRDFVVERQPFTAENELLTDANKPRRPALKARYGERLETLYREIEARQLGALDVTTASSQDRVARAVGVALGLETVADDASFARLGGDSLGAVRLTALLLESCDVSVPVGVILDPGVTIAQLGREVERLRREADRPSFASIHGDGARWAWARDLRLERFLPPELVDSARALVAAPPPRVVLLTGASGFLGRFVLLELLERASARDGRVLCVVRGADDDAAHARLRAGFATAPQRRRFDDLASSARLGILCGDLTRTNLGLADDVWAELASSVDTIVHAGALVNHALSYAHLFEPNVLGTAELVRLALSGHRKPIHFVSTIGVAGGVRRRVPVPETDRARSLWSRRAAGGSEYAAGYGTSKWAAEILLDEAHERCGVPVTISRCGMILPHREHAEELNPIDAFTRLVFGLVRTGVAPVSFYADAERADHHYDGLPVDLVAAFVASLAFRHVDGRATYHVSNPNRSDGVSLDRIASWVESAGHPLERLPYAQWFETFGRRLEALPGEDRRRSPLPILDRWAHPGRDTDAIVLDTTHFCTALGELTGEREVTSLTAPYIERCARAIAATATHG